MIIKQNKSEVVLGQQDSWEAVTPDGNMTKITIEWFYLINQTIVDLQAQIARLQGRVEVLEEGGKDVPTKVG